MVGLELPVLAMEHMYLVTDDMPEVIAYNKERGHELPHIIDFKSEIYMRQERSGIVLGTYEQDCRPWQPTQTPWDFGQELLAPDLDRIVISGDGNAPEPFASTYEAEAATPSGSVTAGFSNYNSGLSKAGNIGAGPNNSVTFSNVSVPADGMYQLEIDYNTSGVRSFFLTVNDGAATELDLNGSTFDDPVATVIPVQLHAGINTIAIGNPTGFAPDLDRIVVAPVTASANLTGAITRKLGLGNQRIWQVTLTNVGGVTALQTRVNSIALTQTSGDTSCVPHVEQLLPLPAGNIAPSSKATVIVPIDFSRCAENTHFAVSIVTSANNGAVVSTITANDQAR